MCVRVRARVCVCVCVCVCHITLTAPMRFEVCMCARESTFP